jgi:photosystem II stability/assembly factor-like uncharacterized protein
MEILSGIRGVMGRAARRGAAVAALAAGLASSPHLARANGRFPASNMLVAEPDDPSHLVLRATYGLLFSSDGGGSWDWVCEKAVGYGGAEDPSVTVTKSGAVVVGMFHGMARSTDGGCTWQHDATWPQSVVDLTLRKAAPRRVYAATCVFSRDAGGSLFKNAIDVSDDEGESWTTRATLDPTILVDSVEVAESDPSRVYVSAIRPRGHDTAGLLLVSDDDGAHFQELPVPFEPTDRGIYIAAVDPKNAARIYLRTTGVDSGRLLVSDDAGKSFREAQRGGPIPGFALADDGATAYVGGKDGLLRYAAGLVGSAEKTSATAIQCLASVGPTLWACAPVGAGFVLGSSTNGGSTFTPRLTLAGMRGPLHCADGASVATTCAADWAAIEALVNPRLDARNERGKDGGTVAPAAPSAKSSCGCATVGAPAEPGAGFALASLIAALAALVLHRARATAVRPRRLVARDRGHGWERGERVRPRDGERR